jgi:hypothetical protein
MHRSMHPTELVSVMVMVFIMAAVVVVGDREDLHRN